MLKRRSAKNSSLVLKLFQVNTTFNSVHCTLRKKIFSETLFEPYKPTWKDFWNHVEFLKIHSGFPGIGNSESISQKTRMVFEHISKILMDFQKTFNFPKKSFGNPQNVFEKSKCRSNIFFLVLTFPSYTFQIQELLDMHDINLIQFM